MPGKNQIKSKFVQFVTVIDPDSGGEVEIEIRKMESGMMVGIDGSWLAEEENPVYSPYDKDHEIEIPDDEPPISEGGGHGVR